MRNGRRRALETGSLAPASRARPDDVRYSLPCFTREIPPFARESLDGVAKHRARHVLRMQPEEVLLDWLTAFADFPEHPTDRLMDEVVRIGQQDTRD